MMRKNFLSADRFILISLGVIMLIMSGCQKSEDENTDDPANNPEGNEVLIQSMSFAPGNITVSAGTTITWTNKDAVSHSVTSNTGIFDSGTMSGNATFSHLFTTPGTFAYHCSFHASMTGTVTVN